MWWYRDRKDQPEGDDPSLSKDPKDRLAAALSPLLRGLPPEPDLLLAMALLVDTRITLTGGDEVGELSWAEAETLISAACGASRRLYNAFARDFGEPEARGTGIAPHLRKRFDELRAAFVQCDGIASLGG
jgi:hypothetical protein